MTDRYCVPTIRSLPVGRGGIVLGPEDVEQVLVGDLCRVVLDLHHLGVVGPAGADILVARIFQRAALVTGERLMHAGDSVERSLYAPETTGAEACLFQLRAWPPSSLGRGRPSPPAQSAARRSSGSSAARWGAGRPRRHGPDVPVAARADDFHAHHAMGAVGDRLDVFLRHGLEEARPAGAGLELGAFDSKSGRSQQTQ